MILLNFHYHKSKKHPSNKKVKMTDKHINTHYAKKDLKNEKYTSNKSLNYYYEALGTKTIKENEIKFVHDQNDVKIFKNITEELFSKLTQNILNEKVKDCESEDDVLLILLSMVAGDFDCCNIVKMNFNDFVIHFFNFHGNAKDQEQFDQKIDKNQKFRLYENYDLSNYIGKISKNKIKNQQEDNDNYWQETDDASKKLYDCPNEYCTRKFKSINGLKYHKENGHRGFLEDVKNFGCHYSGCEKKYKNYNGLKYHLNTHHKVEEK